MTWDEMRALWKPAIEKAKKEKKFFYSSWYSRAFSPREAERMLKEEKLGFTPENFILEDPLVKIREYQNKIDKIKKEIDKIKKEMED